MQSNNAMRKPEIDKMTAVNKIWESLKENGTYTKDGIDYRLLDQPYASGTYENPTYESRGVSLASLEEMISEGWVDTGGYPIAAECLGFSWDVIDSETDDASYACNWDCFTVRDRLGRVIA